MRTVVAFLALALSLVATSCSHRERANPLDAANPNTGGVPQGFNAIADVALVQLRWVARADLGIDGFQIFRLAPGETLFSALTGVLPNDEGQFFDTHVQTGLEYHYRIHYVVGGELDPKYAEDVATTGSILPWVVDADRGRLLRLSPDGRDVVLARTGFSSAGSLAVTPGLGPIWIGNELGGTVDIVNPGDLIGPRLRGLGAPAGIALDPIDGTAWIADRSGNILHYQASGAVARPASLLLLDDPVSVATDPTDGALWVTEFGGNRLRRYQRDGLPAGARPLLAPARIAVDSTNGEAWVTSLASAWVWRLSPALAVLDSFRLQAPVGVALDWRRRTAWICDVDADALVAVNMDTRAERFRVGGLGNPWDAAVDLATGDVWVVTRGSSRGYRLSSTGRTLGFVPGLGDPFAIRLDTGPAGAPRLTPRP